jgi:amino acid transporter
MPMKLRRQLGLAEAAGLSLSIVAPTMAMAFNVTLVVGAAGQAAPLAFAIGTLLLALVGLSFVAFAKRESAAGSAQAYIGRHFGPRAGFLAGWVLLLSYLCFGSGTAVLVGNFLIAAVRPLGLPIEDLWVPISIAAIGIGLYLSWRNMQIAARLMLALELISMVAIVVLGVHILSTLAQAGPLPLTPFRPDPASGWSGIGLALVFTVLSFAGFEGATTLAEETRDPHRAIPLAVLGTVLLAGTFYVFAAYVQVVGYGADGLSNLAKDSVPLDTLARRYGSPSLATALNLAAALSAFSCVLGSLNAAARMTMVLARDGNHPLANIHAQHRTPTTALLLSASIMTTGILLWAVWVGAGAYYGFIGTIGTLALILVYMGVTGAHAATAWSGARHGQFITGLLGTGVLLWPLYNSLYPVPTWPNNLWPYAVLIWILAGIIAARLYRS